LGKPPLAGREAYIALIVNLTFMISCLRHRGGGGSLFLTGDLSP